MQTSLTQRSTAPPQCSLPQATLRPQCCFRTLAGQRQPRKLSVGTRPLACRQQKLQLQVDATYPEPETEKERSPIDIPQEWITPQPSRRPDIFPEFEKLETPLPKPLPGDPEVPDEEEEEEKKKKPDPEKDPEEPEQPDKEKPAPSE